MSDRVNIGVLGLGSVFEKYGRNLASLREQGRVEITALHDPNSDRLAAAASQFPGASHCSTPSDVITRDDVDAVLVLTSMNEHGSLARQAFEGGKHVLVEKPMATTIHEAQALVDLGRDSDQLLVCAPHVLLSPTYREMHARLTSGAIVDVKLARALYGWSGPSWGEWFYRPGGGALFDLGVYNVTSLCGFLGSVRRVTALVGTAVKERLVNGNPMKSEADDNAQVLLDFGDEVYAAITTGFTIQKYGRAPAIELYGLSGTMNMLGDDWAPRGFEEWRNEGGCWEVYDETDPGWPWSDGVNHLVSCIEQGLPSVTRPEQAFHVLEVMLAALQSAAQGRAVEIGSEFPAPDYSRHAWPHIDPRRLHDRST